MTRRLSSPVLIGRAAELREAAGDLRRAAVGRPSITLLTGEAGIGKTRLARAVADRAARQGFQVLEGSCVPVVSGTLPYGPFTQALRSLTLALDPETLARLLGDDRDLLARIAPVLGRSSAPAPDSAPAGGASGALLLEALFNLLGRLAASAPVLLVVEDLQWADRGSLDALSYLAGSVRDERLAILLTVRTGELTGPDELAAWRSELERHAPVAALELQPLTREETGRLVRSILGWEPGPAVLDEVHVRTDGNPFYVEELLQPGRGHTLGIAIAPSLRSILETRVHGVSRGAGEVLALLSVARRDVDDATLAAASGLSEAELAQALHEAAAAGFVAVEHDGAGDRYRLHHMLIGEAVYDRLLAPERRRLHGNLARVLEERKTARELPSNGFVSWAEIAGHWTAADNAERALPAWWRAGDDADRAFAFHAALDAYQRAITTWGRVEAPERLTGGDLLALLRRAGWAAFLAAAPGGDVPFRRLAVEEADRLGDPEARAVARADLGFSLYAAGEPGKAETVYREAVALVPVDPPSAARAHVLAVLGQVLMNTGRHRQSLALCDEAIWIARALGERGIEGCALNTRGVSLANLGRSREGIESLEAARALALELQDAEETGRAFLNGSEILILGGQARQALALARDGIETCRRMGTSLSFGQYLYLHGALAAYELGDWTTAGQLAEQGYVGSDAANDEVYYLAHIVEHEVARGEWETADRHLSRMADLIEIFPFELQYTGPYATARVELALWRHDPDAALRAVGEALGRLERTDDLLYRIRLLRIGARAAGDLADVARARGDAEAERGARRAALALRRRVAAAVDAVGGMDGGARLVATADLLGVAAEATRVRSVPRPAAWRAAGRRWTDLERPYLVAYARWREGEARLLAGDRAGARDALREARAIAGRLGAIPLEREILGLAQRSRLAVVEPSSRAVDSPVVPPPRQRRRATAFELTPRELDVLALVCDGRTDREIAAALFISPHTVGIHVSRILSKLGAHSRTEAASIAYRLRIAQDPRDPRE